MGLPPHEAINQFKELMDQVDEPLKRTFKIYVVELVFGRKLVDVQMLVNVHQGYVVETLERFLKAREGNVTKAHKMKPIIPANFYRGVRDSQLIGLSGYTREGLPVFAIGAGLSTFDKASIHYYVQSHIQINEYRDRVILPAATKRNGKYIGKCVKVLDMSGLKLSALNQIKLLTTISTVDDLNYPEKTITYYIVNVPYIFSACWKVSSIQLTPLLLKNNNHYANYEFWHMQVVKPLLQERTKLKIRVLQGGGRDELLKIMDYPSLPHFCRRDGSGSGSGSGSGAGNSNDNCYSLDHPFHQELYNYMKELSGIDEPKEPTKQGSIHVEVPIGGHQGVELHRTLESELMKLRTRKSLSGSLEKVKISD
ncbi:putative CRAL-TRIO lipid binding domain-containing protein [Helianthus annuus]|nr:putative CRAL-TRIO lipid binding domain-containing protein [Helianthus annuus]